MKITLNQPSESKTIEPKPEVQAIITKHGWPEFVLHEGKAFSLSEYEGIDNATYFETVYITLE